MQTTNYICDMCKTSKSKEDLCQMRVSTQGLKIKEGSYYNELKVDICKECLEKKGFIINPKTDTEKAEETEKKNSQILESKLIDILVDLGVQFYE